MSSWGHKRSPWLVEKLPRSQCSTELGCVGLMTGGVAPQSGVARKETATVPPETHAVGPIEWTLSFQTESALECSRRCSVWAG